VADAMPIRFRCTYCHQLMGIARRKAGTEVECPTCKGKVLVPASSDEHVPVQPPAADAPPFFEQHDFDFLNIPQKAEPALAAPPQPQPVPQPEPLPRPVRQPSGYDVDVAPMPGAMLPPGEPAGIYLSPTRATLLTVAVILGLALAFSAGLLVGRAL
jgi:phage FluMu protein Com